MKKYDPATEVGWNFPPYEVVVSLSIYEFESGCGTLDPIMDEMAKGVEKFCRKVPRGYLFYVRAVNAQDAISIVERLIDEHAHYNRWQTELGIGDRTAITIIDSVKRSDIFIWSEDEITATLSLVDEG